MEERLGKLSRVLSVVTQTAAQLPSSTDLDFYCSIDRGVQQSLQDARQRLGDIMLQMRRWIQEADPNVAESPLQDPEQVAAENTFTATVGDLVDYLLERADIYLDEYTGRRTVTSQSSDAQEPQSLGDASNGKQGMLFPDGPLPAHIINAQIPHPQRLFTTQPDNRVDHAWSRPLRRGKPNAQVPLGWRDPRWDTELDTLISGPYSVEGDPRLNPYYVEITSTDVPSSALETPQPQPPEPLDIQHPTASTEANPFHWVSTKDQLEAMQAHLAEDRVKEIAVDLEHHNKHSYLGIVCLMQISTRYGDYIVDTLSDEIRENAESLNEVFTDPSKVMVLHGADHDVLWLQRDLGVYLTCLFDTYHATNVLTFSVHSLSFLLQRYTSFEADKRFQLADWRIRPLPNEMLYYARSDTHSLLYIYDKLREELFQAGGQDAVREVFERSKATATKVYAKEPWDAQGDSRSGWHTLWLRHGGDLARASPQVKTTALMGKEERMMRRLHQWRDQLAREEDESAQYVLSVQSLMHIVFRMPTTPEEVKRAVPASAVAVRRRAAELAQVIKQELAAWEHDAQLRGQDARHSLNTLFEEDKDDLGQIVDTTVPASLQETKFGAQDSPSLCASIWTESRPSATTNSSLFAHMLSTNQQEANLSNSSKTRRSLFQAPEASAGKLSGILKQIRNECADYMKSVFGGSQSQVQAPNETGESARAQFQEGPVAKEENAYSIDTEAHVDPTDSQRSRSGDLQGSDDEIVPVTKKARWTKNKKREHKTQSADKHSDITPFDYAGSSSVLETKPEPISSGLLKSHASESKKRKGATQEASKIKTAKRKNDMRSSNKSATFGRK
ncbi:exosome nuclease subunit [Malassezia yamatoensis]|uniref:Exosome nuclease subunit n=1 Tax=Malassezia yamatoensis TaxID=253288 RepID=A0AAJ5YU49_9BASI|nr:exosome nuclease subunit [Malassezia yamatoensis]